MRYARKRIIATQNQFYAAKPFILRRLQIHYLKTGKQKVNFSGFLVCKGSLRAQKYSFLSGRLFTRFLADNFTLGACPRVVPALSLLCSTKSQKTLPPSFRVSAPYEPFCVLIYTKTKRPKVLIFTSGLIRRFYGLFFHRSSTCVGCLVRVLLSVLAI